MDSASVRGVPTFSIPRRLMAGGPPPIPRSCMSGGRAKVSCRPIPASTASISVTSPVDQDLVQKIEHIRSQLESLRQDVDCLDLQGINAKVSVLKYKVVHKWDPLAKEMNEEVLVKVRKILSQKFEFLKEQLDQLKADGQEVDDVDEGEPPSRSPTKEEAPRAHLVPHDDKVSQLCSEVSETYQSLPRTYTPNFKKVVQGLLKKKVELEHLHLCEQQRETIRQEFVSLFKAIVSLSKLENANEIADLLKAFSFSRDAVCNAFQELAALGNDKLRFVVRKFSFWRQELVRVFVVLAEQDIDVHEILGWPACSWFNEQEKASVILKKLEIFHNVPLLSKEFFAKPPKDQIAEIQKRLKALGVVSPGHQFPIKAQYYPTLPDALLLVANDASLSPQQRNEIIDIVVRKNPVFVYENWDQVQESDKQRIADKIPYFGIEAELQHLEQDSELTLDKVMPLITRLHELNRTMAIPLRFYRPAPELGLTQSLPYSLDTLIERVASSCTTKESFFDLVTQLTNNYFVGTNWLLGTVYPKACSLFPRLDTYFTLHYEHPQFPLVTTPFVTDKGAWLIAFLKLMKKIDIQSACVDVFEFDQLKQRVRAFCSQPKYTKGFFLTYFRNPKEKRDPTPFHYSPLYLEKSEDGVLKIFNSDSLGKGFRFKFAEQIEQAFGQLHDIGPCSLSVMGQRRQQDDYSCVVFAIRDLIEAANMANKGRGVFDHVPPPGQEFLIPFMKIGQSLSQMKGLGSLLVPRERKVSVGLQSYIQEHLYVAPLLPIDLKFYRDLKQKKEFITFLPRNCVAAERECTWFKKIMKIVMMDGRELQLSPEVTPSPVPSPAPAGDAFEIQPPVIEPLSPLHEAQEESFDLPEFGPPIF